jgi:type II secretory pathway pseudopilin PulG
MAVDNRNGQDDPWTSARASAREDVVAALAPRERRCPSCGAVQRASRRNCERCGADLTQRSRRWRPSRRLLLIAGVAAVLLAAVAVPVISGTRDRAAKERRAAAARQAKLEAAERARLRVDARPVRATGPAIKTGEQPLAHRAALVALGQTLITRDARARVAAGRLDGPIHGTQCTPYPNSVVRTAAERDPAVPKGRYDCVAYKNKFEAPPVSGGKVRTGLFGYPYWLVIDYGRSTLVWCKVTPRAGEGGRSLAFVPVPAPCRDPAPPA